MPGMDLKNLKTQVTYRIEPKPGGGFIARATDPAVPSIEAPTQEELQEKIRAQAFEKLGAEFPALKRLLENPPKPGQVVRSKHSSTFVIRSTGNETEVTEVSTPEQKEEFAKELRGLVNQDFPELAQALAASDDTKTSAIQETGAQGVSFPTPKRDQMSVANAPITPEANRWPLVVLALLILGSLMYFIFLHR